MNKERLLRVADAIEQSYRNGSVIQGLGFNMKDWISTEEQDKTGHECSTTACVAGWAVMLKNQGKLKKIASIENKIWKKQGSISYELDAYAWFEADAAEQSRLYKLFYVCDSWECPILDKTLIEPWHAVSAIRTLAETGEFSWSDALETERLPDFTPEDYATRGLKPVTRPALAK